MQPPQPMLPFGRARGPKVAPIRMPPNFNAPIRGAPKQLHPAVKLPQLMCLKCYVWAKFCVNPKHTMRNIGERYGNTMQRTHAVKFGPTEAQLNQGLIDGTVATDFVRSDQENTAENPPNETMEDFTSQAGSAPMDTDGQD